MAGSLRGGRGGVLDGEVEISSGWGWDAGQLYLATGALGGGCPYLPLLVRPPLVLVGFI
jgi:hypothetical protein